jgi:transposase
LRSAAALTCSRAGSQLWAESWHNYSILVQKGRFVWPPIVEGALHLTSAQLALLIEGIDWRRTVAPEAPERPSFL